MCALHGYHIIKTLHLRYAKVLSNSGKVNFNKPFPNKCLTVMLTDYRNQIEGNSQGIESFDKNGFTFFTSLGRQESFYYLAIGY